MKYWNLLYWIIILENWKIIGLDKEHIVTREDGKDIKIVKNSTRGKHGPGRQEVKLVNYWKWNKKWKVLICKRGIDV